MQQVTRDPLAAASSEALENRSQALFSQMALKVSQSEALEMKVKEEYLCDQQTLRVSSEWETNCAFCFFEHFKKKLSAQSYGAIESPNGLLDCQQQV